MYNWNPPTEVGATIPAHEKHGVSVTLPTWASNVAYEEGEDWIAKKMRSGYPRFLIHYRIQELCALLEDLYGRENELSMIFPNSGVAQRARDFIKRQAPLQGIPEHGPIRFIQLSTPRRPETYQASVSVLFYPKEVKAIAKQYWQHTGEGVSSRMAEYFHEQFENQNDGSTRHETTYVEERFGRNLDLSRAEEAKIALRKRMAHHIAKQGVPVKPEDVYLYPTGMTAIYSAHRVSMEAQESEKHQLKSVCFGFPYTDTLKVLEKWGPGAIFYPFGNAEQLDELEELLKSGERISALFCEFPSNPLLRSPDIKRIRKLADQYNFLVIVDETVGNVCNINAMPFEDISVCSLTKIFSGESNVMGGSLILNPEAKRYEELKKIQDSQFVDAFWVEDAIYLERNSRDFVERNAETNKNAEAVVELLSKSPIVKTVHYPTKSDTLPNYDAVKIANGGYGGLLSVVFKEPVMAIAFFDSINIHKGPSLGTNFTLACPYAVIAHYHELDFVESCGVDKNIIRISVGIEATEDLLARFEHALQAATEASTNANKTTN